MKKIMICMLLSYLLAGCYMFRITKFDIEQGNIITDQQVSRLHSGMSIATVKEIMGNPVLINIFSPHRVDYVYYYQKAYSKKTEKRITCIFRYGRLQTIYQHFSD